MKEQKKEEAITEAVRFIPEDAEAIEDAEENIEHLSLFKLDKNWLVGEYNILDGKSNRVIFRVRGDSICRKVCNERGNVLATIVHDNFRHFTIYQAGNVIAQFTTEWFGKDCKVKCPNFEINVRGEFLSWNYKFFLNGHTEVAQVSTTVFSTDHIGITITGNVSRLLIISCAIAFREIMHEKRNQHHNY